MDRRTLTKDPIDVASGEVVLRQPDVELAGILPLTVERTHLSSYRAGGWFGRSWASTLDQRLEIGRTRAWFADADGTIVTYLRPETPGAPVLPDAGPCRPLRLTPDGTYTISDPRTGRTWHFAATGDGVGVLPVSAISDRNGNRIEFERDGSGTPTALAHSCGYRIAVGVHEGRVRALRLVTGRGGSASDGITLVRYGYDETGDLAEVVNSSGLPLRFSYDENARLTGWADRNGHRYHYSYDERGRAVRGSAPDGFLAVTLRYGERDRTTSVTDSLGHTTLYRCNERGQIVSETNPLGAETLFTWDRHDRLLSRTDPLGRTTRFVHDDAGNLTTLVRADGSRISARYDARSRPLEITGSGGDRWRFRYDTAGNVIAAIDPTGAESRYGRDARGGLTSITDPLRNTTLITCDAAGLPAEVVDPLGAVTSLRRDAFGRVVSLVDPVGGETRYAWNIEGKPVSRVSPGGGAEQWRYDGEGNLIAYVDAEGRGTSLEYGPFDVPIAQVGPDGARLRFEYDTELRLTSVTDPQGLRWRYRYDATGNLVGESDFNGWEIVYRRDSAGQLVERTDGTAHSTRFVRDRLGNVVERRRQVLGGPAVSGETVATFSYDSAGRLVGAANTDADVRFDRDPAGRVVAETRDGRTVTSVFDRAGRRVRRMTPSGADVLWSYDAAGRPATMTTAGRSVVFGRDLMGREIERRVGGTLLTQAFDGDHRLIEQTMAAVFSGGPGDVAAAPAAGVRQRRSYRYRADGHLTAVGDLLNGTREFDVDPAGRVTGVHDPSTPGWTERYTYDQAGNITNAVWPVPPGGDIGSLGDREYAGTLIRRAGDIHYEHDARGRVTRRRRRTLSGKVREWRYTWDGDDRLTEVVTPDGARWRYRYDPFGRRVAKLRQNDRGEIIERVEFVWDGTVLAETHTGGQATTWVHDGTWPLAQIERRPTQEEIDERFYAIVTDLVGAPAEIADADGRIVWRRRATLWGTAEPVVTGDVDCPLRFPGQYHDPETGLGYNVHRYYDPDTGRYQSPDPLGLTPQPNPYAYVHDPTVDADPLGLMSCTEGNPLVLNLGGEGEVAGAINLNTLIAPLRSETSIRDTGLLVVGSMERIPFADGVFDRVVGNKMPFMHGDFPQNVADESFRVLRPGGTVQLGASNVGGAAWVPYLERANFADIQVQGRHAIGVRA
ncbi:DUF6531 domain-containing protein [Actinoallomurus acaciae]|uniref:DUF6531 domain-containing protein n=1 Tax=Actinoallomurus acaciae TaxID=502577 RepID=A0ABV5YH64_9ACTN